MQSRDSPHRAFWPWDSFHSPLNYDQTSCFGPECLEKFGLAPSNCGCLSHALNTPKPNTQYLIPWPCGIFVEDVE